MRILILSDIHANQEALEACLEVAPSSDYVFNLGDVVGYGASPNEVVNISRELDGLLVRGNHDKACSGVTDASDFNVIAAMAAYWTRQKLNQDNLVWVRDLPQGPISVDSIPSEGGAAVPLACGTVQCVHGSPLDEDEYVIAVRDAVEPLTETPIQLTFFGHTHIQGGFALTEEAWVTLRPVFHKHDEVESFDLPLKRTAKYMINPGSIGQPRDGDWRAAFAVFDPDAYQVTYYRVPYDVGSAQERIIAAGLPDRLATRLSDGR
jgi:predicted phosphodiesterase